MTLTGDKFVRPTAECDAGALPRRRQSDPTAIQVALLALLTVLVLTTTAYFNF